MINIKDKLFSINENGARKKVTILGITLNFKDKNALYQKMINTAFLHSQVFPNACSIRLQSRPRYWFVTD